MHFRLTQHSRVVTTAVDSMQGNLLDLVNTNKLEPVLLEGDDPRSRDDVIKAHVAINNRDFIFHIEGSDQDDPIKPRGLLGVRRQQTAETVKGPIDQAIGGG